LKQVRDKLSDTLGRMVKVNESNKALLNESMEMLQFEMNILQSMKQAPATANYSGNTYADTSYGATTSFDTKQ
jgi:flagellar biosynthesis/type III secretory pathway chaperone